MENIEKEIYGVLSENLDVEESEITLDSHIIDDLGADSLDSVELMMVLEEKYDIAIPDEDVENLYTPNLIIEYLKEQLNYESNP